MASFRKTYAALVTKAEEVAARTKDVSEPRASEAESLPTDRERLNSLTLWPWISGLNLTAR
jgi:hypothetical protein